MLCKSPSVSPPLLGTQTTARRAQVRRKLAGWLCRLERLEGGDVSGDVRHGPSPTPSHQTLKIPYQMLTSPPSGSPRLHDRCSRSARSVSPTTSTRSPRLPMARRRTLRCSTPKRQPARAREFNSLRTSPSTSKSAYRIEPCLSYRTQAYNLVAGCASCQVNPNDQSSMGWRTWSKNCSNIPDGGLPDWPFPVPNWTSIPDWAYANVTDQEYAFNLQAA